MKKIGKNTNIEESLDSKEDYSQADIENTNDEQEDSEKIRSETFIDDNSYSAQMKWGFKRAIRLFIPFCFPIKWVALIQITGHLFKVLLGVSATSGKLFAIFVFFPISCIAYSWSVAKNEKDKYFFALYNPVVSILSCNIFGFIISIKYILPFFAIFCLLSLVPVWMYNYEYDNETDAESENDTQENDNS